MYSLRSFASAQWRNVPANARKFGYCGTNSIYRRLDVRKPTNHDGSIFSRKNAISSFDGRTVHNGSNTKMEKCMQEEKHGPVVQSSRKPFLPAWAKWSLGAILSLLPFGKEKWESFVRLEDEVENVAEVVEKVACVAEKVSGKVADTLPEDSKLKDAAQLVEYVSKEAEKDAHMIIELIHKVDKLKQEAVERVVEPILEHEIEKLTDE